MSHSQRLFRYAAQAKRRRLNMLEPTHIFDDRAANYANGADCCKVLNDEMHSLYLLSFLLTADSDKAKQCFVSGMGKCEEEIGVFLAWARVQARRAILQHAIWMITPAPERANDSSFTFLKGSTVSGETNLFDAIVRLNAFERFVYVMSVLENQSDDDCSTLLRCSRQDVIIARALALERLANAYNTFGQPVQAAGALRTMCANNCS
jgi:hypothetical protein